MLLSIISLLAGCGVFLVGMNLMSEGLERSTGQGLKRMLARISNNRLAGVAIGAGVTGIIQSSAATTVMAIGFVNAGVMTLVQAACIVMGANIGTTVTGVLVSLQSLNIDAYVAIFAFVGVMMTFFKNNKVKNIGNIICGFGLIFVGLKSMSGSLKNDAQLSEFFVNLFASIDFPLLLIIVGAIFTALMQSSSAATGMVIIMVGAGALPIDNSLYIILGSNIGTCITALLASIGTSPNARRTAVIHLTFNVIGTVIFTILLLLFKNEIIALTDVIAPTLEMQIAWFHVIFNVVTTCMLLPFVNILVKFSQLVVKDQEIIDETRKLKFVDDRLLKTPSVALGQVKREIEYMASLARENLRLSFEEIMTQSGDSDAIIRENEAQIDFTNRALTKYLIKLTSLVDAGEEKEIGSYFHVLNDIERIGDMAENFLEISIEMKKDSLNFSEEARVELSQMHDKLQVMYALAEDIFENRKVSEISTLSKYENEMDSLKNELSAGHFARLSQGNCKIELSAFFTSTVVSMERIADHLVNFGCSILSPTGSQKEAQRKLQ